LRRIRGGGGPTLYHSVISSPAEDARLPDGAGALALAWERLAPFATLPTQSADFIAALAETMLAGTPVRLFEAAGPEGVEAMLPLCHAPGAVARWRMPGAEEVFEPGDAVCRDAAAAQRLARALATESRPLDLARIPATSPLIPALKAALKGRGHVSVRPATASPTIALGPQWRQPESQFNSRRRSDFRRAERRAAEFGAVACEMLAPSAEEFDALFDQAIAVEARSWKRAAGTAILCDPAKEAFFRRYLRAACERGEGRVAFLRIDGAVVAMQLAVEWGGRYWLYKIGYDEAYARCSPGTLLMLHALRDAAERGLTGFELMGDAEAWIADLWTRECHECVRVRTYPYTLAGVVAAARDGAAWARGRLRLKARLSAARYALPGLIERHVAGQQAGTAALSMRRLGMPVTAGFFQAATAAPVDIAAAYRTLADGLAGCDALLALKAPAIGFDEALVREIAAGGIPLTFDSLTEPHAERTLALAESFSAGVAIPARWQRSLADAERLREGPCRIRLVKGEWGDPQGDVEDIAEAYLGLARLLTGRKATVGVATHDPALAEAALRILLDAGTPCELEQLRGLPRRRTTAVAQKLGVAVRLYYPFGPGWWPYAVDKALARPYLPLWALKDWLRL
jgi:CelD/BcsL family acetyltransferase involved in cellulose biosynthesis